MSSLAKSQNVCTGCRSRKKKCDGERPSCSSCLKRGDLCFYAGAPSQALSSSFSAEWFPQHDVGNWVPPVHDFDAGAPLNWPSTTERATFNQEGGIITSSIDINDKQHSPVLNNDMGIPTPQSSTSSPATALLPPRDQLKQLVDLYFEKFYQYLPLLHKSTLFSKLDSNYEDSSLLFYSIIAVSASAHPSREIQQSQMDWYNEARALFSKAIHSLENGTETLISANFIIFQSMIATEYSAAWVTLGEAWRKAVVGGYSILDSTTQMVPNALWLKPCRSWVEMEECRRSIWMLFIFDRGMCFPIGLMHAVDDRQLRINFPMDENTFQLATEPPEHIPVQYTMNLDRLITLVQGEIRKGAATSLQFIILAYILLGRISELIYALDYDFEEQKPKIDKLTSNLLRIRLILPRSATDLSAADYHDFSHVVWLNVIMDVSAVHLYHRPLHDGETLDDKTDLSTNWPHCVSAARSSVSIVRDAARTSTDFVINPHLSSMLFTTGRILAIEYACPSITRRKPSASSPDSSVKQRDPALRDDLEILLFTFERLKETLKAVGRKFRNGLVFYITDDEGHVLQSKAAGSRGLLRTCEKWPQVGENIDFEFPT